MVVTQEQFDMAKEVERLAKEYLIPKAELLALIRMGFEAGQRDGLTSLAIHAARA